MLLLVRINTRETIWNVFPLTFNKHTSLYYSYVASYVGLSTAAGLRHSVTTLTVLCRAERYNESDCTAAVHRRGE